jgi:magnesium-protoporphyrin O-methyltransferase
MLYDQTLSRVETYFDKTASKTWEQLTSDAPVSKIRQTVRAGRDRMRQKLLNRLPKELIGARILDAGCGTGQLTAELVKRGASVVATDISHSLIQIAKNRIADCHHPKINFHVGDLCSKDLGKFDYVVAMDSLIYYSLTDLTRILTELNQRTDREIIFTVAPRTKLLQTMWYLGKLAPRGDKSPVMEPQSIVKISKNLAEIADITDLGRISSGFYISQGVSCI